MHACIEQAYFNARHTQADCAPPQVAAARRAATARLSDFEALRCAPFRGGALCAALEALAERDESVPPPPDPRDTLIWRFAHAVAAAQEEIPSEESPTGGGGTTAPGARVAAFRAAAARGDAAAPPLPHRLNVHSRTPLPVSPSLDAFAERHAAALDAAGTSMCYAEATDTENGRPVTNEDLRASMDNKRSNYMRSLPLHVGMQVIVTINKVPRAA